MSEFRISKFANAFVPDAQPSGLIGGPARDVVERLRRRWGGLWVGGTMEADATGIVFTPNALNRAAHEGLAPIAVAAGAIRSIRREFGWFTGIVVVQHTTGRLVFRCYGARGVARALADQYRAP
jgi:hypothetical protein